MAEAPKAPKPADGDVTLELVTGSCPAGSEVTVTWRHTAKAHSHDWIGLYKLGQQTNSNPLMHAYVGKGHTQSQDTISFKVPNLPGSYEFRYIKSLFPYDTVTQNYLDLARHPLTITASTIPASPDTPVPSANRSQSFDACMSPGSTSSFTLPDTPNPMLTPTPTSTSVAGGSAGGSASGDRPRSQTHPRSVLRSPALTAPEAVKVLAGELDNLSEAAGTAGRSIWKWYKKNKTHPEDAHELARHLAVTPLEDANIQRSAAKYFENLSCTVDGRSLLTYRRAQFSILGLLASDVPTVQAHAIAALQTLCKKPEYGDFRVDASARAGTFTNLWPHHSTPLTPARMAKCGFIFEPGGKPGQEDRCRCFCCAGVLMEWNPSDDPWLEHAKWFPNCEFLLQAKERGDDVNNNNDIALETGGDVDGQTDGVNVDARANANANGQSLSDEISGLNIAPPADVPASLFEASEFPSLLALTRSSVKTTRRAAFDVLFDVCRSLEKQDRPRFANVTVPILVDCLWHGDGADLQTLTKVAKTLALLSRTAECWMDMVEGDAVPALLACFERRDAHHYLGYVTQALAQLSLAASGHITSLNGVSALLSTLRVDKPSAPEAVSWSAKALVNLAKNNEAARLQLCDINGLRALCQLVIKPPSEDSELPLDAGRVLAQIFNSDNDIVFEIARCGGIPALLCLASDQKQGDAQVHQFAAKALTLLCAVFSSCLVCTKTPIVCTPGPPPIYRYYCTQCMECNICHDCFVKSDVGIDQHLHDGQSYMVQTTEMEWQHHVLECNGLIVLVELLQDDNPVVHEAALQAINYIGQTGHGEKILECGALRQIVAMIQRDDDQPTQELAAETLANLCDTPSCRPLIRELNALSALVARCTKDHTELMRLAIVTALSRLVEPPRADLPDNVQIEDAQWIETTLVESGALPCLLQEACSRQPETAKAAALALRHLAIDRGLRALLGVVDAKKMQPILSLCLNKQTTTSRLGLEVLSRMADERQNLRPMYLSGVIFTVLSICERGESKQQEYACGVLLKLSADPENRTDIIGTDTRVLNMLITLGRQSSHKLVQSLAIQTLLQLAECREKQKLFGSKDMLEFLYHLAYSDVVESQRLAARGIFLLSSNHSLKPVLLEAGMVNVLVLLAGAPDQMIKDLAGAAIGHLTMQRDRIVKSASKVDAHRPSKLDDNSDQGNNPKGTSPVSGGKVRVKCFFKQAEDDIRIIMLSFMPEELTIKTLRDRTHAEFGQCVFEYQDFDGDRVVLSNNDDLDEALDAAGGELLRLYLAPDPKACRPIGRDERVGGGVLGNAVGGDGGGMKSPSLRHAFKDGSVEAAPIMHSTLLDSKRRGPLRWQKGHLLGRGAFGEVCEALCVDTGEIIAVKQINLPSSKDEGADLAMEAANNLEREIAFMKDLEHKNIVKYLGTDKSQGQLNIFLEFVSGGSISTLLQKYGRLDEALVKRYTRQTMLGLQYLHGRGIVHCDVKGANILVTEDGIVKLADFNSCQRLWDIAGGGPHGARGGDMDGSNPLKALMGTPRFMAPEVVKQSGHGKKADIWSLGCTVVQMLTGSPPWDEHSNDFALMFQIAGTKGPPSLPQGISADAQSFLERCFQVDPKQRPSVDDLLTHPFVASGRDGSPIAHGNGNNDRLIHDDDGMGDDAPVPMLKRQQSDPMARNSRPTSVPDRLFAAVPLDRSSPPQEPIRPIPVPVITVSRSSSAESPLSPVAASPASPNNGDDDDDEDTRQIFDTSTLLTAASRGDVFHLTGLLSAVGVNPNACDYDKRTALHLAASEGHMEAAKLLVAAGADVNAVDRWGNKPIDDALHCKRGDMVAFLKAQGVIATGRPNPHRPSEVVVLTPGISPTTSLPVSPTATSAEDEALAALAQGPDIDVVDAADKAVTAAMDAVASDALPE